MGAPLGNQNGKRGREWRDALRKAYMQYEDKASEVKRGQALFKIGTKVVEMALDGDMDAIREIGNRSDGKAVQVQEIEVDINAKFVIEQYYARLGSYEVVRKMLTAAGADHLLPVLNQLMLEKPERETIEHDPT